MFSYLVQCHRLPQVGVANLLGRSHVGGVDRVVQRIEHTLERRVDHRERVPDDVLVLLRQLVRVGSLEKRLIIVVGVVLRKADRLLSCKVTPLVRDRAQRRRAPEDVFNPHLPGPARVRLDDFPETYLRDLHAQPPQQLVERVDVVRVERHASEVGGEYRDAFGDHCCETTHDCSDTERAWDGRGSRATLGAQNILPVANETRTHDSEKRLACTCVYHPETTLTDRTLLLWRWQAIEPDWTHACRASTLVSVNTGSTGQNAVRRPGKHSLEKILQMH